MAWLIEPFVETIIIQSDSTIYRDAVAASLETVSYCRAVKYADPNDQAKPFLPELAGWTIVGGFHELHDNGWSGRVNLNRIYGAKLALVEQGVGKSHDHPNYQTAYQLTAAPH